MILCASVLILIICIVFCCSPVTGAQTPTRTRCRAPCWTRAGASSTGSEVCGMKASSATLCPLRNVSGSQVSPRPVYERVFLSSLSFRSVMCWCNQPDLWRSAVEVDGLNRIEVIWWRAPPVAKAANQHKSKRHVCAAAHLRDLCHPADPQPKDDVLYYGFSTFAMELNELTLDLKPLLPPTDSRLRPDQRWGVPLIDPVTGAFLLLLFPAISPFSFVKVSLLNCSVLL